jgi:hypothetical protein
LQTDLNELTYLLGPIVTYNSKIWAGVNVRQSVAQREESKGGKTLSNDDLIFYAGVYMLKNRTGVDALRLGYAFDLVTSGVKAKNRTSHEIMVSYMIPHLCRLKPKIKTPRYHIEE